MDFRPAVIKRMDLKKQCYGLVTEDRKTFWESTQKRLRQGSFSLMDILEILSGGCRL